MDESVAYDLADEFATLIEITNTGTCANMRSMLHLFIPFALFNAVFLPRGIYFSKYIGCILSTKINFVHASTLLADDESLALVLSGEETEVENIVVARLGEFQGATLCTRSIKKPTIPVQKVINIFVFCSLGFEHGVGVGRCLTHASSIIVQLMHLIVWNIFCR